MTFPPGGSRGAGGRRLRRGELRKALAPMFALRRDRAQVERLRLLLDAGRLLEPLADETAELLARHPEGLSSTSIARLLGRRKAHVLAVVRADGRIVQAGTGRGTRFRLTSEAGRMGREPQGTGQEPRGASAAAGLGIGAVS